MRVWATGVAVITAQTAIERHGMTVNSFTSVSLDPPLVLVCIQNNLRILPLIRTSGVFALSILRASQTEWSQYFATSSPEIADRLAGYETFTAASGAPILKDALGYFDCQVETYHSGGTHTIVVGRVLAAKREEGEPLVYWNRGYRGVLPAPNANDDLRRAFGGWFHDSRAALNSVLGFSKVLQRGMDGELTEIQKSDVEAIWRSGLTAFRVLSRADTFMRLGWSREDLAGEGRVALSGLLNTLQRQFNGKLEPNRLAVSLPDQDYQFGNLQVVEAISDIIDPASHLGRLERLDDPSIRVAVLKTNWLHFRIAPGFAPTREIDRIKQEYVSLKFHPGSTLDVARLVIQAVGQNLAVKFDEQGVVFEFDLPASLGDGSGQAPLNP